MDRRAAGLKGEEIAAGFLKKEGYRILERNFRCKHGEIDLIAEKEGVICFIEVKARSTYRFGFPEEAITSYKRKRIWAVALFYLQKNKIKSRDLRFDIVSVDLKTHKARLIQNAFEVDF
ncbi:MAG: UPF0102 protein [Deltaproteobacteria bacterium]|jgi:putative endonuclease|nr:hypothetical protein HRbin37_02412 [bacterium HR37]GIW46343.1 MAG: UPF0102 protein [Deltaproteobacteria bacterium]